MTRTILALACTLFALPAIAGVPLGTFEGEVEHLTNSGVRVDFVEFDIYEDGTLVFPGPQWTGSWTDLGRIDVGVRGMRLETPEMTLEGTFDRGTRCFEGSGAKAADGSQIFLTACEFSFQK